MDSAKPQWDRHSILAELRRRGKQLAQLALDNDRNPNSFRHIWTRPNSINERIVSDFLGVPVEELFPDRYPKRSSRIFDNTVTTQKASQKSSATSNRVAA